VCIKQWVNNVLGLCCFANVTKPLKDLIDGAVLVQIHMVSTEFSSLPDTRDKKSLIVWNFFTTKIFFGGGEQTNANKCALPGMSDSSTCKLNLNFGFLTPFL